MKDLTKAYYKRAMCKGRSIVARSLDFLALRGLLFFLAYVWLLSRVHNQALALFLSLVALAMACVILNIIGRMRLERFTVKERARLKGINVNKQLLLMGQLDFIKICKGYISTLSGVAIDGEVVTLDGEKAIVFPVQSADPIQGNKLLAMYRRAKKEGAKHVLLVCAGELSQKANELCQTLDGIAIHAHDADKLIPFCMSALEISDEDMDAIITNEESQKRQKRKQALSRPFMPGRTKRYIFAGLVLLLASFFTSYALYYRLVSIVCFVLAGVSVYAGIMKKSSEKAGVV